jgi:hypothetical protein
MGGIRSPTVAVLVSAIRAELRLQIVSVQTVRHGADRREVYVLGASVSTAVCFQNGER